MEGIILLKFELYDFGFEMQESSDFEIPDFLIPDFRFPIPQSLTHRRELFLLLLQFIHTFGDREVAPNKFGDGSLI